MRHLIALAGLVGLLTLGGWQLSKARTFQLMGTLVAEVPTDVPLVALTFDDGPTREHTEQILAILRAQGVQATFFITGREVEENPAETRALVLAGHELGNHSYSHRRLVLVTPGTVRDELARTDAAIRAAGFIGPIPFRPPYGKRLLVLPWVLSRENRLTAMWSVEGDPDPAATPAAIAATVLDQARPGSIILLHAMYASRAATRAALPAILRGLRDRGLEPVPLRDLLAAATSPITP
jgi:peptidoglycan/xylan/chitin deacetylase (PgdA/CDA1 family)